LENKDERSRKYWISYSTSKRFAILDIKKDNIKINIHDVENIDDPKLWLTDETHRIPGSVWNKTFRIAREDFRDLLRHCDYNLKFIIESQRT